MSPATAPDFGRITDDDELDELLADTDVEPIEFNLYSYNRKTKKETRHTFYAKGKEPDGAWLEMVATANGRGNAALSAVIGFLLKTLQPESREQLTDLLDEEDEEVKADSIAEIYQWLIGEYAKGRPTQPRAARRSGARPTKSTSGGRSRSAASATRASR